MFPEIEKNVLTFVNTAKYALLMVSREIIPVRALAVRDKLLDTSCADQKQPNTLRSFQSSELWIKVKKRRNLISVNSW